MPWGSYMNICLFKYQVAMDGKWNGYENSAELSWSALPAPQASPCVRPPVYNPWGRTQSPLTHLWLKAKQKQSLGTSTSI